MRINNLSKKKFLSIDYVKFSFQNLMKFLKYNNLMKFLKYNY